MPDLVEIIKKEQEEYGYPDNLSIAIEAVAPYASDSAVLQTLVGIAMNDHGHDYNRVALIAIARQAVENEQAFKAIRQPIREDTNYTRQNAAFDAAWPIDAKVTEINYKKLADLLLKNRLLNQENQALLWLICGILEKDQPIEPPPTSEQLNAFRDYNKSRSEGFIKLLGRIESQLTARGL